MDSVRTDDLGTCNDPKLTGIPSLPFANASPNSSRCSRVGRTQHDENALAAAESAGGGHACGDAITGDDEIDGSHHCVRLSGARSLTTVGPLSVRKNASICRNSAGFSRSGRSSLCPVPAAGARL
jgi:hypothetical protein